MHFHSEFLMKDPIFIRLIDELMIINVDYFYHDFSIFFVEIFPLYL